MCIPHFFSLPNGVRRSTFGSENWKCGMHISVKCVVKAYERVVGLWNFVVKGSGILFRLRIIKADRYGHIISSVYFGGSYIFGSVHAMWMKIPPFNSVINLKVYERVVGLWNFVVKGSGILFRLRIIKADRYGHIISSVYASVNSSIAHPPPRATPGHVHFFLPGGRALVLAKLSRGRGIVYRPGIWLDRMFLRWTRAQY
jgi:hypothetical protein